MKLNNIHSQIITRLIFDSIAIIASYLFQYFLRFKSGFFTVSINPDALSIAMTGAVMLAYWLMLFFFSGMYKNWHLRSPFEEVFNAWKVSLIGTAIIVFFVFYGSSGSPRMLFLLYFLFLSVSVSIGRLISRRIQVKMRENRIVNIPTIIIGSAAKALDFFVKTQQSVNWGYRVEGIILLNNLEVKEIEALSAQKGIAVKVLGTVENLNDIVKGQSPEEIIITTDTSNHLQLMDIVSVCSESGLKVNIEPDLYSIFTGQTRAQSLYGIPLIEIKTQLLKPWQETIKRIFDIVFSAIVLILGSPVWIAFAIIIKIDSPGKVIYKQTRVGKYGKIFTMYKFRSMRQIDSVEKELWTSVNDPRVTRFGRFIRKTHLDEIPQFWNVLIGDMSVVGPRPEQSKVVEEISKDVPYYKRRLIVRPGITGWWQVKYQPYEYGVEEIQNRLKDDFYYIENLSLQLDFEIIVRTVWCVVKGHGQA